MFLRKTEQLEVPINSIIANVEQPRKIFESKELVELKDSILEFGVIQPLIVKPITKDSYMLIAGERRLRAAEMAGLTKVPVVVRDVSERDVAFIALIENIQRQNLNFVEEAEAYQRLMDDHSLTQIEIAQKVGKQQSTISNKIRILSLPRDIQKVIMENKLTERHARALLRISDSSLREQILQRIVDHSLNVKQSEKLINDVLEKQETQKRKEDKVKYINHKIYINTLRNAFSVIHEVEKDAKYYQEDKGDFMEIKILIPKTAVKTKYLLAK